MIYLARRKHSIRSDIETHMNIEIKPSQLILLEDQNNNNSNCFVFNVSQTLKYKYLKKQNINNSFHS